jgi:flagellar M-ring protein FliF
MDLLAGLKQTFGRLGFAKIGAMGLAAAGVLVFLAWIATHANGPMGLLYAGLDPTEAGRIGQRLDELKVPYEAKGDGTTIMVPQSEVARVRMELAAAGLPHQGGAGYELLDQQSPMNMTSFMQRVQRVRALEGELARTIVTLNGVRSARVHIVLPERETFSRETPKATASVAVVMAGPMRLAPAQAAAIRLLIAGAVPGLQQDDVSVLDPSGIVLAADGADVLASARLTDLKTSRERSLEQAVTGLLEPLVGHGKVRVVASVDVDTERAVTHEEKFDPLSQVERSKQTQVDQESSSDTTPQQPVSVGANLPNTNPTQTGNGEKTSSSSTHNGQTINYEISSVRNETIHEPGDIRRLTLAVVVDGSTDAHGTFTPRSPQELAQFTALVQSAVGYDAKRGDKITVDTLHFLPADDTGTGSDVQPVAAQPVWIWASIGALAVLLLAAATVMLTMRKRYQVELARREAAATAAAALTEETGANVPVLTAEQRALIPAAQADAQDTFLMSLYDLIDQRPDEALAVLRAWIAGGAA